jgi:hypothetical protein
MDALLFLEKTKIMKLRVKDYNSVKDDLGKTAAGRKQLRTMQRAIEADVAAVMSTPEYQALVRPMPPMDHHKDVSDDEKIQLHAYQEFGRLFPDEKLFGLNVCAATTVD